MLEDIKASMEHSENFCEVKLLLRTWTATTTYTQKRRYLYARLVMKKCAKGPQKVRVGQRGDASTRGVIPADHISSSPEIAPPGDKRTGNTPRDAHSASDTRLPSKSDEAVPHVKEARASTKDSSAISSGDMVQPTASPQEGARCSRALVHKHRGAEATEAPGHLDKGRCCPRPCPSKKSRSCSPQPLDSDDVISRQIREIHHETRKSARIIRDSRARLLQIQKKATLSEAEVKELGERTELLLREMELFGNLMRNAQRLVGAALPPRRGRDEPQHEGKQPPWNFYEADMFSGMQLGGGAVRGAARGARHSPSAVVSDAPHRSKSEVDLSRKLSESYDMQEKLAADNADLELNRFLLYQQLMARDQNLEMCREQIKRLQGELKLMNTENILLHDRLNKNNPQGDACTINQDLSSPCQQEPEESSQKCKPAGDALAQELDNKPDSNYAARADLERQIGLLEEEVAQLRAEMESVKGGSCRGGGGQNTCFQQPAGGPTVPPMSRACGVCPPCPAPCNPNAPPTPAEREVQRLTIQLQQTEENFKTKVTECAMLRAELLQKKEEGEKDRCQLRLTQNKLRELEMRMEGLATVTNMNLGTKEQAFEQEVNMRNLKQCYREAREEIDELRTLMKEQNDQLQDYRAKYLQNQQLVEEQRRQMDMMDMENTRISEQINLEIQRVKLKFQEKLQELAPIPDLLKATQMRLKDAQQAQAIAEHNAEQLARELNCAREKVHVLLHNSTKPPEKPPERGGDEKQIALLNQRVAQLTDANMALKSEIERLKSNVIRMEESVLANERRLQEKMHECAQLGGEMDRARDEAARALQRAHERTDTTRKCLQITIAELERQLAASRAQVKTTEKEREEIQCRMQCQIKRLNENFEQAQLRILGLQTQVQTLRRTVSSTGEGEGDQQECACKSFFDNP